MSASLTFPTATSSNSPTSSSITNNGGIAGFSTSTSFYRNLFYILVGVVVIFLIITLLSYIRTRRRRQIVEAEARRLGLLVPGMAGYLTERARLAAALKGQKKSSKEVPLIWNVLSKESTQSLSASRDDWANEKLGSRRVDFDEISALALVPLLPEPPLEPIPISSIKYFPNVMAFRAPKPEISAEMIMKQWEAELTAPAPRSQGSEGEIESRRRGRTRGKSLIDQYPQEHVPPLRLSIERPRTRKTSRAAELADQLGNKIFGPPRLPAEDASVVVDVEAQGSMGGRSRANTGVEMTQIVHPEAASRLAHDTNTGRPNLLRRDTTTIPPLVQLVTFVRMPIPEQSRSLVGNATWHLASEEEQEKAVQAEWAGVELGITEMEVVCDGLPTNGDVWCGSV